MYHDGEYMENQLYKELELLETEKQNLNAIDIDLYSTKEVLKAINKEDQSVAFCVGKEIDSIEKLTEAYIKTLDNGGRVFYIGAGTSGRIAFIDAAEIPPTYGIADGIVEGIMCGGLPAMKRAKEAAEDQAEEGTRDLKERNFCEKDLLIGVAASGRTPYVINAMEYAKTLGAKVGSISCVKNAKMSKIADYPIEIIVGQEIILGSTRMKSATAQKLVLNMISTAVMVRKGRVYKNSLTMGNASTEKAYYRKVRTIANEANVSIEEAERCFKESKHNAILALCMAITKYDVDDAKKLLDKYNGRLREALQELNIHR